jgi:hypothetical protein
MEKVCVLINWGNSSAMIFKDENIAKEYLKEWKLKEFENGIWAKTKEDIEQGIYYSLATKEIISD